MAYEKQGFKDGDVLAAVNLEKMEDGILERICRPTTATIGQTIRVSAVDANGYPSEWEAVDLKPTYEVLVEETVEEDVNKIEFDNIQDYNEFLLVGDFLGKNTSGVHVYVNGKQCSTRLGSYFVHNHTKRNISTLEFDREREFAKFTSSSQQMGSLHNLDVVSQGIWFQTLTNGEEIRSFSFVLDADKYFAAGSTYTLWGKK